MKTSTQTAKHTPTPWSINDCRANKDGDFLVQARHEGWLYIATVRNHSDIAQTPDSKEEAGANARLIASAPDLLEALKAVVAALTQPVQGTDLTDADRSRLAGAVQIMRGDCAFAVNTARSAIARATQST
jgi:hypothetical protein